MLRYECDPTQIVSATSTFPIVPTVVSVGPAKGHRREGASSTHMAYKGGRKHNHSGGSRKVGEALSATSSGTVDKSRNRRRRPEGLVGRIDKNNSKSDR